MRFRDRVVVVTGGGSGIGEALATARRLPGEGVSAMWEIDSTPRTPLSHDMLCVHCGHGVHVYLPCGDDCDCGPHAMPGLADPSSISDLAA